MPQPRKSQIAIEATPYYHCVSRCVRRAFLCGEDRYTGKSFEHRRGFLEKELLRFGDVFFLDVVSYAVMSNHYHIVLFIDAEAMKTADANEVVRRWHQLHKGSLVSCKYLNGEALTPHERDQLDVLIDKWRERLSSISWYMRVLNEKVARMANSEDKVTGRFWEGRFKCQALVDDKALLSCMAYVDLNPVRAAIAKTPEDSDHTSVKRRVSDLKKAVKPAGGDTNTSIHQLQSLHPFVGGTMQKSLKGIPFNLSDYLQLLDWTGRQIRKDKVGVVDVSAELLLDRLSISAEHWVYLCTRFENCFKGVVGSVHSLKRACLLLGRKRMPNLSSSQLLFA